MKKNQGAVLIYVLLFTAMLASVLVTVQATNQQDIKILAAQQRNNDAKYLIYSGQQLIEAMIRQDQNSVDGVGDKWFRYRERKEFPVNDGTLSIQVVDANELPNLNQVMTYRETLDPDFQNMMRTYMNKNGIHKSYINAVMDWIDKDDSQRPGGGEKNNYFSYTPAYKPPNNPILSYGELRLLEGYRPEYWEVLKTSFAIIPWQQTVNVNTISESYLNLMFPDNKSGVNRVLRNRKKDPYETLGGFYEDLAGKEVTKEVEVGVITSYFNVELGSHIHGNTLFASALYKKSAGQPELRRWQWK